MGRTRQQSPLLPIFLIVLVDVLGFTMVIPLLAYYSEHFGASPLVATSIVSVYAFCSLISTPILGRLSDQFGRRPLLLISQAGTFCGFLVLGFANALWMVFLGRIIDGVTAGNFSIAQAYVSDHSAPENRAKAFGVMGVAFGIGFLIGPTFAGILQKYDLHLHQLPADAVAAHQVMSPLPFVVAAGMSALSIACTFFLLPKELPPQTDPDAPAAAPAGPAGRRPGLFDIAAYRDYFSRPALRALYVQFFLFAFAFACFTSGFALFAERRFVRDGHAWTATEVGYLFGYSGLLGIFLQGGLIGRLVKKFGEVALVTSAFVAAIGSYVLLALSHDLNMLLLSATASAYGNGVLRPVLTSLMSKTVGRNEQGTALGISGSLQSLALMLGPISGGVFINYDHTFGWAMVSCGAAGLGLLFALRNRAPRPAPAAAT